MVLTVAGRSDSQTEGEEEQHRLPGDESDGERRALDPPPDAGDDGKIKARARGLPAATTAKSSVRDARWSRGAADTRIQVLGDPRMAALIGDPGPNPEVGGSVEEESSGQATPSPLDCPERPPPPHNSEWTYRGETLTD